MKTNLLKLLFTFSLLMSQHFASAQCTINSSGCGGYTVQVSITPTLIVPSSMSCPFGYNYNVTFDYSITVSGANTCFNGNIGIQPQIFCNSQNNGYFTISVPAPIVGTPSTINYTGTLTTTTNPYSPGTDCATATPLTMNCNSIDVTIFGPGISTTTVNCSTLSNTISTGAITGSPFCAGAAVSVPYTATGTFTGGNVFTAQLSNSSGSFASPTNIGTISSTSSGTISATIPGATPAGAGYRIRVVSSTPSVTGSNNGSNITINSNVTPAVAIALTSGTNPSCNGSSVTFTATPTNGGASPSYQWTKNGSNIIGANSSTYSATAGTAFVSGDLIRCVLTSNATCASPLTATSAAINMTVTPSTANFYITGVNDPAACNRLEEQVKWTSLANVVATGLGNSLNKTSSNGNWDGGAFSYNSVYNNGYLEFTATETNTSRMIGLSTTNADNSYGSIRYAIFLQNNGTVGIYETGINRGNFGTYAASDVFRVSVENNIVKYYKNNVAFYFSSLVPSFPMYVDVSINNVGGTITNALVNNLNAGTFLATVINGTPITFQWRLNGSPVGTNSASYSNASIALSDVVTCDLSYSPLCGPSPVNTTSNSTTYKALPAYDVPVFYITGVTDPAACNRLEEQVKWTNLANVVATGVGNSLNKTTSNNNWDGGAFSFNQVNNNGYLEFTATETNTSRMIGLSTTNADNGYGSIRYAIFLQNNGTVGIYETGINRGNFGSYAASDVFRVSVENNFVKYYKNNTVFYYSLLVPSFPMYVDVSINNVGGTLTNVVVNNLNSGSFTAGVVNGAAVSYQWLLNGTPVGTNSASYTNASIAITDVVTCDLTYQSICATPTISSNSTTYKALPTYDVPVFYITGVTDPAACNRLEEQVKWTNLANVVATGAGNSLNKTTSNNNWDGGAFSFNQVNNNGYLEFTATETNTNRMIGLSTTNADNGYGSIRYAIFLQNNGSVGIYETGINRGNFGSYAASDVFRVSVENNFVKYYKNNTVFYYSLLVPSFPMYVDVSINNVGGTLTNVLVNNLNSGSFTAGIVNGTAVSYQWLLNGAPVGTNSSSYTNASIAITDVVTCDLTYQSICATPTISSNSTTYKALPTYDVPVFYITGVTDPAACNRLEEQVKWTSLANVVATGAGNSLNKTTSNNNWDGGAFSFNQVNNNGYIEFTATETNTARMIGLSTTNADNGYGSIRYAIFLQNNGTVGVYETGISRGNFGSYAASDVFRVSVENNFVKYYKNNTVFYYSLLVPSFPMYVDVSINNVGGTLTNVLVNNLNSGSFTAGIVNGTAVSYQWLLNGAPVGTNSASYTNASIAITDVVTCDLTYQSICATPTISSNSTTYKALPTYDVPVFYITGVTDPAACNRLEEQVKWTSLANVVATGAGNSLNKTTSNNNWDGGAFSFNQVNNNGYIEFTATETNTSRMIGLSTTNVDNGYGSIRYAIFLQNNGTVGIYETGINRGNFGSYAASDVFRVSVENNFVKYYKNNTVFYYSLLVPSFPMYVDVSINNVGGTLTNVLVNNLNSGSFTAGIVNGTAVSYQWLLNGAPVGTNSASYTNASIAITDVVTCDLTYQSICATPTISSNSTTYKALPTYDVPVFYITGVTDPAACNRLEEQVKWTSLANVVTTGAGNSLNKTTSNNNWDGGAFSFNQVNNNGYLEFTATETNRARMIGLSTTNADNGYGSIRYAIFLQNNGTVGIYETGINRGNYGTYAASDVFRVSVENSIVKYYKNNTAFYNSSLVPSFPMYVDVSINNVGGTISNAFVSNLNSGSFTASVLNGIAVGYQWYLNGAPVGTNSASYTNASIALTDVVTCDLTYQSICNTPTITSNSTTYKALPTYAVPSFTISAVADQLGCPRAQEQVIWTGLANVVTTGLGNSLNKTSSNNNWDGGAFSVNTVSNNGYFEFTASETNRSRMVGLSSTNADNGYGSIRYAIFLQNNGVVGIYEGGANRGNFGAYSSNALFRISVESNVVKYYRNGTLFYTSALVPSFPLYADVSINQTGGTVTNAIVANLNAGSFIATTSGAVPLTYQWYLNGNPVGTNSSSYTDNSITIADVITCDFTYSSICATPTLSSNSITIINGINSPALVSIGVSPSSTICNGSSATFTATPTNGGASPSYQWTNNGIDIIGETSSTYIAVAGTDFISSDNIRCVLTSNATCAIPAVVTSSPIVMIVSPNVIPSVALSLTTGANPTCSGSSLTFTASPTNGGGSPTFNFRVDGNSVQNSASATFTTSAITNGQLVDVILTSNANCAAPTTATSTGITMTIDPVLVPTISISSTQTNLCTSGMDFTSSISNGGASPSYQWKRNGGNILGETNATYTATNLINGDLITCELTSDATCASPAVLISNSITVNLTGAVTTWLGLTNDWSIGSPINWDNGYPSSNVTAIIPAGTPNEPQINDIVECFNIEIQAGASLTINAVNQLNVYGKFTNNGTFTAGFGAVEFLSCSGSSAQAHEITSTNGTLTNFFGVRLDDLAGLNLTSNATISGALTLSNGTFNNASNTFTFISTASGTARIASVPATANYVGNITMQRFAPGPKTGWAQLGTPVQSATLAQWQDDFATSGYTGATGNAGGFISVYTYNEPTPGLFDATGSYLAATNVTNSIPVGRGFWLYLGTATVNTANITIDVTGQPTIGNFSFNPSYTNSGNPADDGFNLVANPYPSAIDWLSPNWTKTNINNAIYMYQADNGQYASFVGGISTNGGSRFIASSQGFYIQTNGVGPVLDIQETAKSSANPVLIKEEDPANVLRLKVNGDNVNDEMVIHLNENATANFDGSFDAKKIFSNEPTNPSISSINNNKDLSINSLPFSGNSMSIPVRVTVGNNGMYNLSWSGMEGFSEGSCFVIEDLDNGTKTTLEKDGLYYFNATIGFKAPRFIIHISTPLPKTVAEASCNNSQDGSITINNPSTTASTIQLKDNAGNLIKEAIVTSNNAYTFDKLAIGTYQLSYPMVTACGNMNQTVNIEATKEVNANFEVSAQEVTTNEEVNFTTSQSKGNNLTWDFGDGTTAIGESSIKHQYQEAGIYNVSLTNIKGECSITESITLNVSKGIQSQANSMEVSQQNGEFYAVFNFSENTLATIRLTNALGQEIATTLQFEGKNGRVRLQLDNAAEGVYMIILNDGTESITKKIVKQ
jgi:hypothetical protein